MRLIDADALIARLEVRAEKCQNDFNKAKSEGEKDILLDTHASYIKMIGIVNTIPTVKSQN